MLMTSHLYFPRHLFLSFGLSYAVWWSVDFMVVFCVQRGAPVPFCSTQECVVIWNKTHTHTQTYWKITQGVRYIMYVGSAATDSILRNETSRKVFFVFFFFLYSRYSRRRALHLQETIGERRGTDDLWK